MFFTVSTANGPKKRHENRPKKRHQNRPKKRHENWPKKRHENWPKKRHQNRHQKVYGFSALKNTVNFFTKNVLKSPLIFLVKLSLVNTVNVLTKTQRNLLYSRVDFFVFLSKHLPYLQDLI